MRQQIYWTQRGTQLNHLVHAVTFLTGAPDEIQMNNTKSIKTKGKNRQLLINSQIKSESDLMQDIWTTTWKFLF